MGLLHLIPLGLAKHVVKHVLDNVNEATKETMHHHLVKTLGNSHKDFFHNFQSRQGKDLKSYVSIITHFKIQTRTI